MDKYIDLEKLYSLFKILIEHPAIDKEDSELLNRFVNKISESDTFARKVHECFRFKREEDFKTTYKQVLAGKAELPCGFKLEYDHSTKNWVLYKYGEVFLDLLSLKLVKNIVVDINNAYLIKASREEKSKQ